MVLEFLDHLLVFSGLVLGEARNNTVAVYHWNWVDNEYGESNCNLAVFCA